MGSILFRAYMVNINLLKSLNHLSWWLLGIPHICQEFMGKLLIHLDMVTRIKVQFGNPLEGCG